MKTSVQFFLFAAFLVCLAAPGFSQQAYQEEYIRFYQGLPSDIVQKTQVDSKGLLYVATQRGLSLYDGYRFITSDEIKSGISGLVYNKGHLYFHDRQGLSKISYVRAAPQTIIANNYQDRFPNNDHFDNIFIDSRQRIWCTDFNNIKYIDNNKAIKYFEYDAGNNSIDNGVVFVEPVNGNVWAFTRNGLFIWNERTNQLKRHPNAWLGNQNYKSAFMPDKYRIFFALADGSIHVLNLRNYKVQKLPKLPDGNVPLGFGMLANKNLIVYTRQHIFAMTNASLDFITLYTAPQAQISHVLADKRTRLIWVSTNKGLVKLSPVEAITTYKIPQKTTPGNLVLSVVQEKNGNIWLINKAGELWLFDRHKQWKSYPANAHFSNVSISENEILLASDQGLFHITGGHVGKMNLEDLPKAPIKKAIIIRSKELWLLYGNHPIVRYKWPSLEKINQPFANSPDFWAENTWNDIIENTNGSIWISGWCPKDYGIVFFDARRNKFVDSSELRVNKDEGKYFGDYVNRIAKAPNAELLFSGYGGFSIVAPNGNVRKTISINDYPIANGHIEGIGVDNEGDIVFATGDGLHVYNPKSDKVIRISQIDGLPTDDLIYGFTKLNDGTFALGTDNGLTVVDVRKLLGPKTLNRLELTQITVDGKPRAAMTSDIELSKDENDMVLHFSNLSFSDRQKVFYRYKFKDDPYWSSLGNNPELSLNHIVPGKYELAIQTGNHMGQWQERSLNLTIVAHPPYYQSVLFYIILGVLAVMLLLLVNRQYLKRKRKEAQYMQKIRESEMQTLRAQMNPHFMFNTLNSINSFIIENKTEAASGYLTTFSKLMRSILEYSKEESISLDQELQALKLYLELEAVRLDYSFDYTINVPKSIRKNDMIKVPPLILQPFVENAIWHGLNHKPSPGNLYINVTQNDDRLTIRIEDDGIGREAAKQLKKKQTSHKSYGIEITQQRILMLDPHNAVEVIDLEENGKASGTAVIIILKI